MKKVKFKLLYLFLGLVVLHSCTSDLDVVSADDDVSSAEKIFSTQEGYKQALAGVYGNLSLTGTGDAGSSFLQGIDAGTSHFARCLWYLQELTTDEVIWSYENDGGVRDLQRNTWTSDNVILLGFFSRSMAEVALANEFLRQTSPDKVAGRGQTDPAFLAEIEDYRNEAKVLRAYAYYNLMDLFGKAPFITENDPLNFAGPEYDRQQLFTFIEEELNAAIPNLKAARTNEYGRIDKAFAQMVLAKMYLNAEVYIQTSKYNECMAMCSEIIAGGYSLKTNYLDNFKADNNTSEEMIFTLQSDGVVTQNYGATTVMCNGQIGEKEANGATFGVGGWGGALRIRKQFAEKFNGGDFDFDARKTIGIYYTENNVVKERPIDITDIATRSQGYILSKFSNISSTGVPGVSSTFVDTDFPLFRLGDVYLMYAEAQLRKDGAPNGTSVGYINLLRERANGGAVANIDASDLTLDFILDERARELHWEAHRRQDLIRFGKYTGGSYNWAWKGNASNGISLPAYFKLFPIPAPSLASNLNLTQNTGY